MAPRVDDIRIQRVVAAAARPGLLEALCDGALDAVVLTGALDPRAASAVAARLNAGVDGLSLQRRDHRDDDRAQVGVLGLAVSPSDLWPGGPEPASYYAAADPFRRLCAQQLSPWPSGPPLDERAPQLLASMARSAVQLAQGPGGDYGSCTLRHIPSGCGLPPHCENDYLGIAIYEPLRQALVLELKMSFVTLLQAPEEGALALYGWHWEPEVRHHQEVLAAPAIIEMEAGDMVVFNSGRTLHGVGPVAGGRARWTMGGFVAPRRDGRGYWYWA